jgi:methionyl-tRNA formyltransferase
VVHRDKSFLSRQSEHNNDLASINSERETSKKVLLLCGHTSRSVAYIQALSKANIVPDSIIVYGAPKGKASSQRLLKVVSNEELFSPNLDLDLLQSLEKSQWQYTLSQAKELDEPSLLALIEQFSPDLIIYSGYGGQLVPVSLLNNYPVLHIHSGWLPDYRGSTTLYYQIIDENSCAASAILLDEKIDTGDIVVRQRYPIPTPGMDVDYLYDNMIRADLLIKALNQWHDPAQQWQVATQTQDSLPYFIIHPLLKHLALLTVDKEKVNL